MSQQSCTTCKHFGWDYDNGNPELGTQEVRFLCCAQGNEKEIQGVVLQCPLWELEPQEEEEKGWEWII